MRVAPVYHTVLKQLSQACKTRPHFVEDVRFILSLPLSAHHDKHTVVHGTTSAAGTTLTSTAAPLEIPGIGNACEHTTVENYLLRPPSMCYPIDGEALFALCYADLQGALRQPPRADANVNPVTQQILDYRNLLWLRDRLTRVLSDKTTMQLSLSLSIGDGPDADDFIPDEFFAPQSGSATERVVTGLHGGFIDVASGTLVDDAGADKPTQQSTSASASPPSPSSSQKEVPARPAVLASGAVAEDDPEVVYSAGAVGLQKEMFVLRHREPFPMAAHFLAGFPTIPAAELAQCAHERSALMQLTKKIPTTVTCEDGHIRLSVVVEPFDPRYRTREHAGFGYFAKTHRNFSLQFSMQLLAPDAEGVAERTELLVVNSYFLRLDMELLQVTEEVGYLDASDVFRMLRERDYGDCDSDDGGEEEHSKHNGNNNSSRSSSSASDDTTKEKHVSAEAKDSAATSSSPSDNARVFSLFFATPTDAPMVLKGLLYYKTGKRSELAKAPIRCIPFGFVRLEP